MDESDKAKSISPSGSPLGAFVFLGLCVWWSARCCWINLGARRKNNTASTFYDERRGTWAKTRVLRTVQFAQSFILLCVLSCCLLLGFGERSPTAAGHSAGQLAALLLGSIYVAACGWITLATFLPFLDTTMIDYHATFSTTIFVLNVAFVTYCQSVGLLVINNGWAILMAYVTMWALEDVDLVAFLPSLLSSAILLGFNHGWRQSSESLPLSDALVQLIVFSLIGTFLPLVSSAFMHVCTRPSQILLCMKPLVEPLQDLASTAGIAAHSLYFLDEPRGSLTYRYGFPAVTSIPWATMTILLALLGSFVISILGDSPTSKSKSIAAMRQVHVIIMLRDHMKHLSLVKIYAISSIAVAALFQAMAVAVLGIKLLVSGPDSVASIAQTALLFILVGVMVEVLGVIFVIAPGSAEEQPESLETLSTRSSQPPFQRDIGLRESYTSGFSAMPSEVYRSSVALGGPLDLKVRRTDNRMGAIEPSSFIDDRRSPKLVGGGSDLRLPDGRRTPSRPGSIPDTTKRKPKSVASFNMNDGNPPLPAGRLPEGEEEWEEEDPMRLSKLRIKALVDFKTFMQSLDKQPAANSLEFFIAGSSSAIKDIFPGVHHASFCLLSATRVSVNMYTFLGDGCHNPPKNNVAVAPGTLIFHVLHTSEPVFISDIAVFPGPYSDVQFMRFVLGLKSVACLPLTVGGGKQRILGVLRLGFDQPRMWDGPEKSYARQLALVLSNSTQSMGRPLSIRETTSGRNSEDGNSSRGRGPSTQQAPTQAVLQQFLASGGNATWQHDDSNLGNRALMDVPYASSVASDSPTTFSYGLSTQYEPEKIKNEITDIKMMEIVGRGGFGSVYKAFWRGKLVAVKVLEHGEEFGVTDGQPAGEEADARRAALLEGAMTSTIKHPNVVTTHDFRVVDLKPQNQNSGSMNRVVQETHIIMDFCDRGSLQDAMEQNVFVSEGTRSGVIDLDLVIMTLAEVAFAVEYLHAHRITHRDLKPKNILLKTSNKDRRGFRSLVSDFGLSQVLPDKGKTHVSTKYSGTVTHMPPELIEEGKVYPQGDTYAFGIIMWEVYTGSVPFSHMAHPQIMVAVVSKNMRPKFPENCPEWYQTLASRCWRRDPKTRPTFTEISEIFMSMLKDKSWSPLGEGGETSP